MMKRRIAMNLFSMLLVYLCCIVLTSGNNDKVSAFQITRTTARGIKLYQLVRSNDKFPSEIRPKRFTNDRFNQQNGSLNKNFDVIMKSSLFGHDSAVPHRGNADFDNQETIFSKLMHFRHRFLVKFMQNIKSLHRKIQKTMIAAIFVVTMFSSTLAMATSGGRIGGGGSFKSRSPSMSRPSSGSRTMAPPSRRIYSNPHPNHRPQIHFHSQRYSPPIVVHHFSGPNMYAQQQYAANSVVRDVLLLAAAGSLIAYGISNNAYRRDENDDKFGAAAGGATIASITVALDVPRKNDPNSIIVKLGRLADTANTISNRGLKDLVTAVAIELTRQQSSIDSAYVNADYYRSTGQAEREFQLLSVKGRSKVDRLTVNKFGSENRPDERKSGGDDSNASGPTKAIVSLNVAMGGNFVGKSPLKVSNRPELIDLLTRIGSDVQLEENTLVAAEVLWSPEDPNEELTKEEIYSKYPNLLPL